MPVGQRRVHRDLLTLGACLLPAIAVAQAIPLGPQLEVSANPAAFSQRPDVAVWPDDRATGEVIIPMP